MPADYCYPESSVFYRSLNRTFVPIVRGEGCWLIDKNGKRYLDASSGAFAACLGHGLPEVGDAIAKQIGQVAYVNGTAFTNSPTEDLAQELAGLLPKGLEYSYFLSSGSEAVEAALKLARQFWVEVGKPGKHKIITGTPGYHGNTLLALSTSARKHYQKFYSPWLTSVSMMPAPYPYRCPCQGKGDCAVCSGQVLEEVILKEGAETVAAFILEPIGGSSTGASVPRPDYFKRVREICDKHQVLWIDDEVLTGCGRTGKWLGVDHFKVVPDILVLGKGLSAGVLPVSAVVTGKKILDPLAKGYGSFSHAQTFSHTPAMCSAALAAVRQIKKQKLVERVAKYQDKLQKVLKPLENFSSVGDVRGIGFLYGVEFVEDKKSKKPFSRKLKVAETFTDIARENGLIVWPNTGQADGENGDLVMIAPPFIISESEINEIGSRFKKSWEETLSKIVRKGN